MRVFDSIDDRMCSDAESQPRSRLRLLRTVSRLSRSRNEGELRSGAAFSRRPLGRNTGGLLRIAQLLVPVRGSPLRREVEQVPDRLQGAHVAGILSGIGGCVEELRAPEVADHAAVTVEHIQHRPLCALGGLGDVVAVVGVAGRGQEPQPAPAAFFREGDNSLERRLRYDGKVDEGSNVLCGALELIEEGDARRARAFGPVSTEPSTVAGPGRSSPGSRGNIKL